jgi:hypothetical protein
MAEDASGKLHFVGAGEASLGGWKVS